MLKAAFAAGALALAAVSFCAPASAADRKVNIINKTSHTMSEFYASTSGTQEWEEDILDKDELAPGESVEVDIDDGTGKCKFDFMGVFDDGDKVVKNGINVCTTGTFTFND